MWTFLQVVFGSLLGSTIGAQLSGYYKERGKRLATREDIDNVLGELQTTTQMTKSIEAAISHEAWKAQMCWQERKAAYSEMIEYFDKAERCYRDILSAISANETEKKAELIGTVTVGPLHSMYTRVSRLIRIFGSPEAVDLLDHFGNKVADIPLQKVPFEN